MPVVCKVRDLSINPRGPAGNLKLKKNLELFSYMLLTTTGHGEKGMAAPAFPLIWVAEVKRAGGFSSVPHL